MFYLSRFPAQNLCANWSWKKWSDDFDFFRVRPSAVVVHLFHVTHGFKFRNYLFASDQSGVMQRHSLHSRMRPSTEAIS